MRLGFIGAGNMATALARGIGEPVFATDVVPGKAEALVEQVGGEVLETPAYVADAADAIVLAHKPAQLADVAGQLSDSAKLVVSILGGAARAQVEAAYPGAEVHRFLPNIPVELGQGVLVYSGPGGEVVELFG